MQMVDRATEGQERTLGLERAALGSMLIDPKCIPSVVSEVAAADFSQDAHTEIFAAILTVYEREEPVDILTLSAHLQAKGRLEAVGGFAYLTQLESLYVRPENAVTYARGVHQDARERRLRSLGILAAQAFAEGNTEAGIVGLEEAKIAARDISSGFLPSPISVRDAFDNPPEPADFVLPGLEAGTVGSLVSTGGVGKSFSALSLGASVAAGLPFFGGAWAAPDRTGGVLCINAEDNAKILRRRMNRLGHWLEDEPQKDIAEANKTALDLNLAVMSLYGRRPILIDKDGIRKDRWRDLARAGTGLRLIIFDTLTRFHGLEEKDNGEMSRLMMEFEWLADETGAAILLLHHVNKLSALSGQDSEQHSARGASAITDNGRWTASLRRPTKDEAAPFGWDKVARRQHVILSIPKANNAETDLSDVLLRRTPFGFLVKEAEWDGESAGAKDSGAGSTGNGASKRSRNNNGNTLTREEDAQWPTP